MLTVLASAAVSVAATSSAAATASAVATGSAAATGGVESLVMTVVPSAIASALPSAVTTTVAAAEAAALVLPAWLEVAAVFAGALASALFAVRKKLDLTGVITIAIVGGLGGGIIRDLLLQTKGIYALETPRALVAACVGALIGAFFYRAANTLRSAIVVMDAVSLSLFCVIGADKAIRAELWWLAAIGLGVVTAVGGGVLRDVLTDSVPAVLKPGGLYAVAAFAGSSVFVLMVLWLPITKSFALVVAALLAFGLRVGSLARGWRSPEPFDLTPMVAHVPAAVASGVRRVPIVGGVLGRPRRESDQPEGGTGLDDQSGPGCGEPE